MHHVYMTQCSLLKAYHQLSMAREAAAVKVTPLRVSWFTRLKQRLLHRA